LSVGFGHYIYLPTYSQTFSLLNVYVKHGETLSDDAETAAASVVASIRAGSFFNCIEAIAPANGFDAVFESETGERLETGGASSSDSGRLLVSLPFDFETDVVVRRNGEVFRELTHNQESELTVAIDGAGVYRVEVYACDSSFDDLPWIMCNPFLLDTVEPREVPEIPAARRVLPSKAGFFRVECDPSSECSLVEGHTGITGLRYALPAKPVTRDYSAALANRKARSFAGFRGLTLRARSEQRARFWLMFRTEIDGTETWYRHSFAADREWSTVAIPFEDFRVHHGKDAAPNLEAVASLFISIDNQIAYPGASGTLFIRDFGLF
jgi:hypothetical protein